MKKIFLFLTIALGMIAMSSCKCTTSNVAADFVYDVVGTAEGVGSYAWSAGVHSGSVKLDGTFTVKATNDTTTVKLLTASVCANALPLSEALVSSDAEVAEAAKVAQSKLLLDLKLSGLDGSIKLGLTGYVKYGAIVFALDEHWQYPPVSVEAEVTE